MLHASKMTNIYADTDNFENKAAIVLLVLHKIGTQVVLRTIAHELS